MILVGLFLIIAALRLNKTKNNSKEDEYSSPEAEVLESDYDRNGKNLGVCDTHIDAKYTPENITTVGPRDIFVFGSNLAGHHAGGAARIAFNRFGAVWGQG